jgi:hypothetical protein
MGSFAPAGGRSSSRSSGSSSGDRTVERSIKLSWRHAYHGSSNHTTGRTSTRLYAPGRPSDGERVVGRLPGPMPGSSGAPARLVLSVLPAPARRAGTDSGEAQGAWGRDAGGRRVARRARPRLLPLSAYAACNGRRPRPPHAQGFRRSEHFDDAGDLGGGRGQGE